MEMRRKTSEGWVGRGKGLLQGEAAAREVRRAAVVREVEDFMVVVGLVNVETIVIVIMVLGVVV